MKMLSDLIVAVYVITLVFAALIGSTLTTPGVLLLTITSVLFAVYVAVNKKWRAMRND